MLNLSGKTPTRQPLIISCLKLSQLINEDPIFILDIIEKFKNQNLNSSTEVKDDVTVVKQCILALLSEIQIAYVTAASADIKYCNHDLSTILNFLINREELVDENIQDFLHPAKRDSIGKISNFLLYNKEN